MIEKIVDVGAELQLEPLGEPSVLDDREIEIAIVRSDQRVPPQGAEMTRSGRARIGKAAARESRVGGSQERTGHREGAEIQKVAGIVVVVTDGPNHVGTIGAAAAGAGVIDAVVVQVERVTG